MEAIYITGFSGDFDTRKLKNHSHQSLPWLCGFIEKWYWDTFVAVLVDINSHRACFVSSLHLMKGPRRKHLEVQVQLCASNRLLNWESKLQFISRDFIFQFAEVSYRSVFTLNIAMTYDHVTPGVRRCLGNLDAISANFEVGFSQGFSD
ncbi:hypothetical protein CsSME_00028373 [Camellia sinensis var. sinensis]